MDIDEIRKMMVSKNVKERERSLRKVKNLNKEKILKMLNKLLYNRNPSVRMTAAAGLRKIIDDKSAKYLARAINHPINRLYRGSFVYALQTQNCKRYFTFIFKLALYGSYEVQNHALLILEKQRFNVTADEHKKAQRMINLYPRRKDKCYNYILLLEQLSKYLKNLQKRGQVESKKIATVSKSAGFSK